MMNQRRIILFIAASLDGYIATNDHSLDWLFEVEGEGDNGYSKFYDTVDTVLLGRTTYEWIIKNEKGSFPYKDKECYVFSRTRSDENENVKFTDENVVLFTKKLKERPGKNIWIVGGGDLLNTFINERLVDELFITVAPVLIGSGVPLFKHTDFQTRLLLKGTTRLGQMVELHYEIK